MNIWFIVVYLIAGFIGVWIVGDAITSSIKQHESEYGADDKRIREELDEFDKDLNEFNKTIPILKRIINLIIGIVGWPITVPYQLHIINNHYDEMRWITKNGKYE